LDLFSGNYDSPTRVAVFDGALQVAVGSYSTYVLDASGMLSAMGDNYYGEFGDGTQNSSSGVFRALGRQYRKLAVSPYSRHACGIAASDNHVECWGYNYQGDCGDPNAGPLYSPVAVASLGACSEIVAMHSTTCALCNGIVSCWGDDIRGQLGIGQLSPVPQPNPQVVALPAGETWVGLAAGYAFACARAQSGKVACWGKAAHGGLGTGGVPANLPMSVLAGPAPTM
jgi:alpha-tubulin suppressor-like RCC1 family protein